MQALTSNTRTATPVAAEAVAFLQSLIRIPSHSRQEHRTADLIAYYLQQKGVSITRKANNVWARNKHFDASLPTLLLNSHHDTVKANDQYTRDPFEPAIADGKLFGLGSNDAGGALVSLLQTFLHFYEERGLKYNLVFCASAEEEISGANGIASVITELEKIDAAIVGEPTSMQMAIAEKGLLVLDCTVHGKSGHAAREEGDNAIMRAMQDLNWFQTFSFPKKSETLGPVKMNVTVIQAGSQHNVIPATCNFTVDVRTTDAYTNEEVFEIIRQHVQCTVQPRSLRLQPSGIPASHPLVQAGARLGLASYGSPTLSDKALMPWPSLKLGPGDSARSHSADEFIYVKQIEEGIETYINLLNQILH